jgi:hypothetical protein
VEFKSETTVATNGAIVEIGTVTHDGKDFAALGAIVDETRGFIQAYITLRQGVGHFLTTWEGKEIAPVTCVRCWTQRGFYGSRVTLWAWRATVNGKKYHGRNAGPAMFVRMRAKSE